MKTIILWLTIAMPKAECVKRWDGENKSKLLVFSHEMEPIQNISLTRPTVTVTDSCYEVYQASVAFNAQRVSR